MLDMTPTDATLGLTVRGVRLDALDDETFAAIEDAWHAYAVLIFPGQNLPEEAQVAFSERFGPLERVVMKIPARHNPAIIHLSNVKEDGTLWPATGPSPRKYPAAMMRRWMSDMPVSMNRRGYKRLRIGVFQGMVCDGPRQAVQDVRTGCC